MYHWMESTSLLYGLIITLIIKFYKFAIGFIYKLLILFIIKSHA